MKRLQRSDDYGWQSVWFVDGFFSLSAISQKTKDQEKIAGIGLWDGIQSVQAPKLALM